MLERKEARWLLGDKFIEWWAKKFDEDDATRRYIFKLEVEQSNISDKCLVENNWDLWYELEDKISAQQERLKRSHQEQFDKFTFRKVLESLQ